MFGAGAGRHTLARCAVELRLEYSLGFNS